MVQKTAEAKNEQTSKQTKRTAKKLGESHLLVTLYTAVNDSETLPALSSSRDEQPPTKLFTMALCNQF